MDSILEQFRNGNLFPHERSFRHGSKYHRATERVSATSHALFETLSHEQKDLLEEFEKAKYEQDCLALTDQFVYGFRTGLLIGLEVSDVNEKFIFGGE